MEKVYASPYSEIIHHPDRQLLVASWLDQSRYLDENGVKREINEVLTQARNNSVRHVVVDARKYQFLDDVVIQNWITRDYVPRLMDSGVVKYAIVVKEPSHAPQEDAGERGIMPMVEYFSTPDEALKWIQQTVMQ